MNDRVRSPVPNDAGRDVGIGFRYAPKRYALRASQGYAPCQADDKEKKQNEKQKGDTSNEVTKGTFLKSFDTPFLTVLTVPDHPLSI